MHAEFTTDAKATVESQEPKDENDIHRIVVRFPAAEMRKKCRVYEYEITAILCEDDVELVQMKI